MLELVLWSFVLALTPLVLGLAWKLSCSVGRVIDRRDFRELSPAAERPALSGSYSIDLAARHRPVSRADRWWES